MVADLIAVRTRQSLIIGLGAGMAALLLGVVVLVWRGSGTSAYRPGEVFYDVELEAHFQTGGLSGQTCVYYTLEAGNAEWMGSGAPTLKTGTFTILGPDGGVRDRGRFDAGGESATFYAKIPGKLNSISCE